MKFVFILASIVILAMTACGASQQEHDRAVQERDRLQRELDGLRGADGSTNPLITDFDQMMTDENTANPIKRNYGSIIATASNWDNHIYAGVLADGTVVVSSNYYAWTHGVDRWTDIVAISTRERAGMGQTIGIRADGTIVFAGSGMRNIDEWHDIVDVSANGVTLVGLRSDGTVVIDTSHLKCVYFWEDIVAVSTSGEHTVGLRNDGTVVATASSNVHGRLDVDDWYDIIAIKAGSVQTIGIRADGTVISTDVRSNFEDWTDIIAISAYGYHVVGLRADGTVMAMGANQHGQLNVDTWQDIIAISSSLTRTIGLKADGTVVTTATDIDISGWNLLCHDAPQRLRAAEAAIHAERAVILLPYRNMIEPYRFLISASPRTTVGVNADGTVVAVGYNDHGQLNVEEWRDIVAVSASATHTVGLRSDGTVVATGRNREGQSDVGEWRNIVAIAAGTAHTVGLRSNGTVVAVGLDFAGKLDVGDWRDIVAIDAGGNHTVGLTADGTVLIVGSIDFDGFTGSRDDVGGWYGIAAIVAESLTTVGLRADGRMLAAGSNASAPWIGEWNDIVSIAMGISPIGLRTGGTVVVANRHALSWAEGWRELENWRDIVAISASDSNVIGLRADGTVVAVGSNSHGQLEIDEWRLFD